MLLIMNYKIRRVASRGTPSYQLGYYSMIGGKRRSVFKLLVHLGEHPTPDDAISAWSDEVVKLRAIGRDNKADKLERKLEELRSLS